MKSKKQGGNSKRGSLSILGIALAASLLLVLATEGALRWARPDLAFLRFNPCITFAPGELVRFIPGCRWQSPGPFSSYSYEIDALGLREMGGMKAAPKIAYLGDSVTEGYWLNPGESLVARLHRLLDPGNRYGIANFGLQGTGPSQQILRFRRLSPGLGVRRLVWFLNGTDPLDESYFSTLSGGGLERSGWYRHSGRVLRYLDDLTGRRMIAMAAVHQNLRGYFYRAQVPGKFDLSATCERIRGFLGELDKLGVKASIVILPEVPATSRYYGLPAAYSELGRMLGCLKPGVVFDLRDKKFPAESYGPDGIHLDPATTEQLAALAAERLNAPQRRRAR